MIGFTKSNVYCVLALAAFSSLFNGATLGSSNAGNSIGIFAYAAPTPHHRPRMAQPRGVGTKVRFGRQDGTDGGAPSPTPSPPPSDDGSETLGKLMNDYNLLKAAVPAAPEGSDLQNALLQEIDNKKQTILDKFGQVVPDAGAPAPGNSTQTPVATTVTSMDGSLATILPNPDGPGVIIASDGQNKTVSLGPDGSPTPEPSTGDQQTTISPTPTSTSTVVAVSTSTAPTSGTSTNTTWVASSSSTQPSASAKGKNGASTARPFDILPSSAMMRSLFTVTTAMVFGAWTVL
ncbi:hypothetical protein P691DRAFT_210712 [Macrolepiota fuliginosa MF-IS2]|uniref:Uncharacterized protein n=1 Tax=Macrolepiota fuliginosa MF-IS2 TaxID=1400762 RepID=A0A9P6C8Y4_9AGAR|nr:hypothetical protein P691DRAFT_210712 [Macrolepiota fuliginosa MF-IS2]